MKAARVSGDLDPVITDPNLREIVRLDGELQSAHRLIERLNIENGKLIAERNSAHFDANSLRMFILLTFGIWPTNPYEAESRTGLCSTCSGPIARDGTCSHVRKLLTWTEEVREKQNAVTREAFSRDDRARQEIPIIDEDF